MRRRYEARLVEVTSVWDNQRQYIDLNAPRPDPPPRPPTPLEAALAAAREDPTDPVNLLRALEVLAEENEALRRLIDERAPEKEPYDY